MSGKLYVGNAKAKDGKYGQIIKLSFSRDDLAVMLNHVNERGYVNLDLMGRKTISEWGHTHSISIDDWNSDQKPQDQAEGPTHVIASADTVLNTETGEVTMNNDFDDDIPF